MKIEIVVGDITKMACEAIVNSANPALVPGGGVSGAIHKAAGPKLAEECAEHGWCHTGQAVITYGYNLPARYCIHTVGPMWRGGDHGEAILLKDAYQEALKRADVVGAKDIAFPLLSAGIYRYPLVDACRIALEAIMTYQHTATPLNQVETVYIVVMDETLAAMLQEMLAAYVVGDLLNNVVEAGAIPNS